MPIEDVSEAYTVSGGYFVLLNEQDSLTADDGVSANFTIKQLEQLNIATNMLTFYNPQGDITEQINAVAQGLVTFNLEVNDQYNAGDALTLGHIVALADSLVAAGVAQTFYQAVAAVASALTVGDATYYADAISVADGYDAEATTLLKLHRIAEIINNVGVSSSIQNALTIVVQESAEVQAGDSLELTASLLAEIMDSADVFSLLKLSSDLTQSWVVNTEGEMPISEYDNFDFNSLVHYKGEFYGASDSGLYIMGADDDAGAPITAELASLMLDFGTSRQKRMRSAYLGYTSSNELVLKVRSVSDGVLSEHWYKACPVSSADAPREGRVFIGQGLRSRYWQFELTNVNGGDFEIDQLELYPLFLSRRV